MWGFSEMEEIDIQSLIKNENYQGIINALNHDDTKIRNKVEDSFMEVTNFALIDNLTLNHEN